jgi:hypothetical protein
VKEFLTAKGAKKSREERKENLAGFSSFVAQTFLK